MVAEDPSCPCSDCSNFSYRQQGCFYSSSHLIAFLLSWFQLGQRDNLHRYNSSITRGAVTACKERNGRRKSYGRS